MSIIINDTIETYINNLYSPKNDFMAQLREKSELNCIPIITKDVEKFMDILIQMNQPKKMLELGTAVGYSAISYCLAKKDLHITTVEISDNMYDQAMENIKTANMSDRIKVIKGDAKDVMSDIDETFDIIFIDAAKAQYKFFFEHYKDKLNPDGIIISDNILYKGMPVAREFVVKRQRTIAKRMGEFIEHITHNTEFDSSVIPIGDGIGISIRKA